MFFTLLHPGCVVSSVLGLPFLCFFLRFRCTNLAKLRFLLPGSCFGLLLTGSRLCFHFLACVFASQHLVQFLSKLCSSLVGSFRFSLAFTAFGLSFAFLGKGLTRVTLGVVLFGSQ